MKDMTEAAMLAEIEKALKPAKGEDGFTVNELATKMGHGAHDNHAKRTLSRVVGQLIANGKAQRVRIVRANVWGVTRTLWGVRFGKAK